MKYLHSLLLISKMLSTLITGRHVERKGLVLGFIENLYFVVGIGIRTGHFWFLLMLITIASIVSGGFLLYLLVFVIAHVAAAVGLTYGVRKGTKYLWSIQDELNTIKTIRDEYIRLIYTAESREELESFGFILEPQLRDFKDWLDFYASFKPTLDKYDNGTRD